MWGLASVPRLTTAMVAARCTGKLCAECNDRCCPPGQPLCRLHACTQWAKLFDAEDRQRLADMQQVVLDFPYKSLPKLSPSNPCHRLQHQPSEVCVAQCIEPYGLDLVMPVGACADAHCLCTLLPPGSSLVTNQRYRRIGTCFLWWTTCSASVCSIESRTQCVRESRLIEPPSEI